MTRKRLSICVLCYNNSDLLKEQLRSWSLFSKKTLKNLEFVVVDDGSKEKINPDNLDLKNLDLNVFRIERDIPWNIGGGRNLSATVSKAKWILIQDLDIFVNEKAVNSMLQVMRNDFLNRTVYKFGRVNPATGRDSPHPGTMLLPKKLYWRVGGCDEDFAGHYGFTDVHFFKQRVAKSWFATTRILYQVKLVEDARGSTTCLSRSTVRNEKLYKKKSVSQEWSTDYLRFNWSRVR